MLNATRNRTFTHSPFAALDEFMNIIGREGANAGCCRTGAPAALAIDIRERASDFVVEASLPGFQKNEVDVQMHEGLLTIAANREAKNDAGDASDGTWLRRERVTSSVTRQVRLPEGVTGEGISAELSNGVLTVSIPKPAQPQPRKISIA